MFGKKRIEELEAKVVKLQVQAWTRESDKATRQTFAKIECDNGRDMELEHLKHEVSFAKRGEKDRREANSDLRQCNTQLNQRNIALKGDVAGFQDELVSLNNKLEEKEKEVKRLAGRLNNEPRASDPRMFRTDSGLKEKVEHMGHTIRSLHSALDQRDDTIKMLQKHNVGLLKQVQTPIYIVGPTEAADVVASLKARTDRENFLQKDMDYAWKKVKELRDKLNQRVVTIDKLRTEVDKRKDTEERLGVSHLAMLQWKKKAEAMKRALFICRRLFINLRIEPGSGNFTQIWAEKGEGVADVALKD